MCCYLRARGGGFGAHALLRTTSGSYVEARRNLGGGRQWAIAPPPHPTSPQILADQLTLFQPGGADYAHHITTRPPTPWFFRPSYSPAQGYYRTKPGSSYIE